MFLRRKSLKIFILLVVAGLFALSSSKYSQDKKIAQIKDLETFLGEELALTAPNLEIKQLPPPYDFLLSQPLLTIAMEKYYQRNPIILAVSIQKNNKRQTYSRIITMLIDSNKSRNDAVLAQKAQEEVVLELAAITMNFAALSENIKKAVLTSKTPFGKLLAMNKIDTRESDRRYFSLSCSITLARYLHCREGAILYGRTNTILSKDSGIWLARVVELVSARLCQGEGCLKLV